MWRGTPGLSVLRLGHYRDGCLPGKRDAGVRITPGLMVPRLGQSRDG